MYSTKYYSTVLSHISPCKSRCHLMLLQQALPNGYNHPPAATLNSLLITQDPNVAIGEVDIRMRLSGLEKVQSLKTGGSV